ncbi:MAG TPA: EAL domain-containing protein, partial [Baekduia sp.]|nr:EAL domain-containing protein [Baekduia sp.]
HALGEIVGLAPEVLVTRRFQDITHPPDLDADLELLGRLIAGDIPRYDLEKRYVRADGTLVWVHLHVSLVRDDDGVPVHAIAQIQDISARKRSELAVARYEALVASAGHAIYTTDLDGRLQTFNAAAEALYGHAAGDVVGRRLELLAPPGRRGEIELQLAEARHGRSVQHVETQRLRRDGSLVDVHITTSPVRDATGASVGMSVMAWDISDLVAAERDRTAFERLFRTAFEHAPIGFALVDVPADGDDPRVVRANGALAELLGAPAAALEGAPMLGFLDDADRRAGREALLRLRDDPGHRVRQEIRLRDASGRTVPVLLSAAQVEGSPERVVVQLVDISDRKAYEARLQRLADHDPLTGLVNRRRFEEELEREIATAARYGTGGALLLLDLDRFKYVNDSLGHSAGDELLRRTGRMLRERLRESDVVARLGGDEFAVILPRADERSALLVAEEILDGVRREGVVEAGDVVVRVSGSLGITRYGPGATTSAEDLLVQADIAMYDAKDAGRDSVRVFRAEEGRRERINLRTQWLERLRTGLADDRFRLFAQPIAGISRVDVPHLELLLRFEVDGPDLVLPGAFLSIAERYDLIPDIDRWVLGQAVDLLEEAHAAGRELGLSVNVSGRTLADPALPDQLAGLLAGRSFPPQRLIIEVTETAAIADVERARRFAQRLQALGCGFALDDFGAGFSSFYYLKHLAFDYVKIDGEFVEHLTANHTDRLVVRAVVDIARGVGARTVAECVGDDATVALLRDLGVDYGQGHHLGRPRPVREALELASPQPA